MTPKLRILHPRLLQAAAIVRPRVPLPTIIEPVDAPGPTRLREFSGLGAEPTYAAKLVRQVHADIPPEAFQNIERSGAATLVWYDEPAYAFNPRFIDIPLPNIPLIGATAPVLEAPPSGFRSTPEEIEERVQSRLELTGPPPKPNPHYRSYLGGIGPTLVDRKSGLYTLDDARKFVRSDELEKEGADGKGVLVAVLDTGMPSSHPMLDGRIRKHLSFTPENPGFDGFGHGSWCGSAIAGNRVEYQGRIPELRGKELQGMAPRAELLDVKVLTSEGTGASSGIIQGVEAAVLEGANILSMSLGSLFGGTGRGPDAQAVDEAMRRGVIPVVASGNSYGYGSIGSPGSARGAVTVGAAAIRAPHPGAAARFSSKGATLDGRTKPNIAAPGGNLGPGGDETILGATSGVMEQESGENYTLLRGSSMATPCVAGVLAQLLPLGLPKDRAQLEFVLSQGIRDRFSPLQDNRVGWGVIDAVNLRESVQGRRRRPLSGFFRSRGAMQKPLLGAAGLAASSARAALAAPAPGVNLLRMTLI